MQRLGWTRQNVIIHGRNLSAKLNVFSRISDAVIFRKNIFSFGILISARFGFGSVWFNFGTLIGTCYKSNIILYLNRILDYNTATKYTSQKYKIVSNQPAVQLSKICSLAQKWHGTPIQVVGLFLNTVVISSCVTCFIV